MHTSTNHIPLGQSSTSRFIIGTEKTGGSDNKKKATDSYERASDSYEYEKAAESYEEDSNPPVGQFKVDAYEGYTRFYDIFGDCFGLFWQEWEDKLGGAIQFYLAENKFRNP